VQPPQHPHEDVELTRLDHAIIWIHRNQWISTLTFVIGVALALFHDTRTGVLTLGSAIVLAGLVPITTGVYHSIIGRLMGWRARVRGLISVLIGVAVIAIVW